MRKWLLTIVALAVMATPAAAQEVPRETTSSPPRPTAPTVPGPRPRAPIIGQVYIGEDAPDFVLDGSKGAQEQMSKQRGQWVLLVFSDRYRSIAGFDSIDAHAIKLGARVVAVCHEKQQTLMTAASRDHVNMLMLADVTGEVSAVYGLYDWGNSRTDPGFFVVDRDGTVRLAVVGKLFPPDQMLELIRFATGSME